MIEKSSKYVHQKIDETSATDLVNLLIDFVETKIYRAITNDFISGNIISEKMDDEDYELLKKIYYDMSIGIDEEVFDKVLLNLKQKKFDLSNYLPIGSWEHIPADLKEEKDFAKIMRYYANLLKDDPRKLLENMLKENYKFVYFGDYCPILYTFLDLPVPKLIELSKDAYEIMSKVS